MVSPDRTVEIDAGGFLDSFLALASADDRTAAGRALSEIRSDDDNGFLRRTGTTGRPSASGMYDFFFSFVVVAPNSVARGETPWLPTYAQGALQHLQLQRTDWACAAALTTRRIVRLRALCSGCRAQLTAAQLMTLSQCGLQVEIFLSTDREMRVTSIASRSHRAVSRP